jgi:hypothetical protein
MILDGSLHKIAQIAGSINQQVFGGTGLSVLPVMIIKEADAESADDDEKGCDEKAEQENARTDLMFGIEQIPREVAFRMNQQIDAQEGEIIKAVEKPDHFPVDTKCKPAYQSEGKMNSHSD